MSNDVRAGAGSGVLPPEHAAKPHNTAIAIKIVNTFFFIDFCSLSVGL